MKWNRETRKLSDLKDYEKNPRKLEKEQAEQLKTSLDKFGQCEPVVVNQDGTIIGGHQRCRTLRKMGEKIVDVYVPERVLEEKEVEELNIRLNKNSGSFDYDILANQFDITDLMDWGFSEFELDVDSDVIKSVEEEEKEEEKKDKTCPNCGCPL